MDFDGVDDYVQTNYSGISGNSARTVEAWIKTTAVASGNQQVILDYGTAVTSGRFTFNLLWNNAIRLEVQGNGVSGSIPVNDGMWHHVAAVYDPTATDQVSLYVDGVLDVAGNLTVPVNTASGVNVRIGKRVDDAKHFQGSIDEVRFWSVARTQTEIQATKDVEFCTMPSALELYFTMNQAVAGNTNAGENKAYDLAGNANHGTLLNFGLSGTNSNWVGGTTLATGAQIGTTSVSSCDDFTWSSTGQTYSSSGEYYNSTTDLNGCDSLEVMRLTITGSNDITTNRTECGSYTWSVNGVTYTETGNYTEERTNSNGCLYDHHLSLTIHPMDTIVENEMMCLPYIWPVTGDTLYLEGAYEALFISVNGCDSLHKLNLHTWTDIDATLDFGPNYLVAGPPGFQKRWYDCSTGEMIPGATSDTFYVTTDGTYQALVSDWGFHCPDWTDCFDTQQLDVNDHKTLDFGIYPNPSSNEITIELEALQPGMTWSVLDIQGRKVKEGLVKSKRQVIDVNNLKSGVYFVLLMGEKAVLGKQKLLVE